MAKHEKGTEESGRVSSTELTKLRKIIGVTWKDNVMFVRPCSAQTAKGHLVMYSGGSNIGEALLIDQ